MQLRIRLSLPMLGLLFLFGPRPGPVRAELVLTSTAPLLVHGIPIPEGAEPYLAASVSLENLHALAPRVGELGRGRLHAVAYTYPGDAPPDEVVAYYRRVSPYLMAPGVPRRLEREKDEAADGMRVIQILRPAGYLVIRSDESSGPTRVTVALVQGNAAPLVALKAVDALRAGDNLPRASRTADLLSPKTWESDFRLKDSEVQLLQRNLTPSNASTPVIDIMRSLLNQARALSLRSYRTTPPVDAPEMLDACQREARGRRWILLSLEAESPQRVMALYRMQENRGMVMLTAARGPAKNVAPPGAGITILAATTEIKWLEVTGPIKLPELFRPNQPRPPVVTLPPSAVPFPRGSFGVPVPRGPFSAHPHAR